MWREWPSPWSTLLPNPCHCPHSAKIWFSSCSQIPHHSTLIINIAWASGETLFKMIPEQAVPAQTELNNRKEWTAALYYNCFSTFRHIQRLHDVHSNMSQPICEIVYCHEHSLFNSEGTNGWLNSQRHSLGRKSDASGEVFLAWRNGPCYLRLLFNLKEGCFWWLVISVSHGQQTIRERIRKLNWNSFLNPTGLYLHQTQKCEVLHAYLF